MRLAFLLTIQLVIAGSFAIRIPLSKRELPENADVIQSILKSFNNNTLGSLKGSSKIDLKNFHKVQYFGNVYLGTPGQQFSIMFDTGSPLFWVPGPTVSGSCGEGQRRFLPSNSRTFKDLNKTVEITYLKGYNDVELVQDTVVLGSLSVANQTLGLVTKGDCSGQQFDGLMGMSFEQPGEPYSTVFGEMVKQHIVDSQIFSFTLNSDSGSERGGELYFGSYDTNLIGPNTKVEYIDIINYSGTSLFWAINTDSININGITIKRNQVSILDTGTSLILAPPNDVQIIANQMRGYIEASIGIVVVRCNDVSDLNKIPSLNFVIGSNEYKYTAKDLLIERIQGYCALGIGVNTENMWLLGDMFLSKVHAIHNYAERKVALVPLSGAAVIHTSLLTIAFLFLLHSCVSL